MITQLDIENADRDLTSTVTVLTHTPSTSGPVLCQASIELGDLIKKLDGSGGNFEFTIKVDNIINLGGSQVVALGTGHRAYWFSDPFPVPMGDQVIIQVKSPNAADTDVDVTARLFDVGVDQAHLDDVTLADDAITSDKFDESTAFPLRANTLNKSMEGVITGTAQTGTLTTTQMTTDLTGYDNDRLIGRIITWTSGPLAGESADITDYASTSGLLTFTAVTEAPTNGNEFVIT